jgi:biopolymer transport protein ExbB
MTDTTTTAAVTAADGLQQAATQAPVSGAEVAGAVNTTASAAADIAPAGHDLTSAFIVDGTLNVLIAFSVVTWALILIKGIQHLRISLHNRSYSKKFWGASDFQTAAELKEIKGPAARVAEAGFTTLREADGGTTTHDLEHTGDRQELLDRRLRQQMQKERGALESGLAILATIGSISPFVGLFGTVWGIMGALTNISKSGSASLEVVAGPIGEALVATAVGIAVAVPAVIAYNFFIRRNKVIWAFLDDFSIDFVHLALKTSFLINRVTPAHGASQRNNQYGNKKTVKANINDLEAEGAQI